MSSGDISPGICGQSQSCLFSYPGGPNPGHPRWGGCTSILGTPHLFPLAVGLEVRLFSLHRVENDGRRGRCQEISLVFPKLRTPRIPWLLALGKKKAPRAEAQRTECHALILSAFSPPRVRRKRQNQHRAHNSGRIAGIPHLYPPVPTGFLFRFPRAGGPPDTYTKRAAKATPLSPPAIIPPRPSSLRGIGGSENAPPHGSSGFSSWRSSIPTSGPACGWPQSRG